MKSKKGEHKKNANIFESTFCQLKINAIFAVLKNGSHSSVG